MFNKKPGCVGNRTVEEAQRLTDNIKRIIKAVQEITTKEEGKEIPVSQGTFKLESTSFPIVA
jgi:hypothetical protein